MESHNIHNGSFCHKESSIRKVKVLSCSVCLVETNFSVLKFTYSSSVCAIVARLKNSFSLPSEQILDKSYNSLFMSETLVARMEVEDAGDMLQSLFLSERKCATACFLYQNPHSQSRLMIECSFLSHCLQQSQVGSTCTHAQTIRCIYSMYQINCRFAALPCHEPPLFLEETD